MVQAFQQGGNYNKVNYGEYVIIDTIVNDNHYNSPENGIIYRRGLNYKEPFNPNNLSINSNHSVEKNDKQDGKEKFFDYTVDNGATTKKFNASRFRKAFMEFVINPGGGAEYVGQIVGPQGTAPQINLVKWTDFLPEYEKGDGEKANGDLSPTPAATFDSNGDVKESEIVDKVKYGFVNIKDTDGNVEKVVISVDIPYSVFKYHAESIEPYDTHYAVFDENQKIWKYSNLISEDTISKNHPYYWQYDLKVPKGIRGKDFEAIDLEVTGKTTNDGLDVDQSNHNYQYYYKTRDYLRTADGQVSDKIYINSFNRVIHRIVDNGKNVGTYKALARNTSYSVGTKVHANGLGNGLCLQCTQAGITGVSELSGLSALGLKTGKNTITDGSVKWQVVNDTIDAPNLVTVHYTHGDNDEIHIRCIDSLIYNEDDGKFYIKYSDKDTQTYIGTAPYIKKVDYITAPWRDSKGAQHLTNRIRVTYNTYKLDNQGHKVIDSNFSLDSNGNEVFPTTDEEGHNVWWLGPRVKFLNQVRIDENTKQLYIDYSDGTTIGLNAQLRTIKGVDLTNEGNLNGKHYLRVTYDNKINGQFETETFDKQPLNNIASIQHYGDNIVVLYSDPDVRKKLYNQGRDYAIPNKTFDIPEYTNTTGNDDGKGNLYWINLGPLYQGNHIFTTFKSVDELKAQYPYGFDKDKSGNDVSNMIDRAGWLATIDDGEGNVYTYAFDYRARQWYMLQDLSKKSVDPELTLLVSQAKTIGAAVPPDDKNKTLNTKGYWFVVEARDF